MILSRPDGLLLDFGGVIVDAPVEQPAYREHVDLYAATWLPEWAIRPGMGSVLDLAADVGIPVAIVSNTLCARAQRDFLAGAGIAERFAAQVYSDEVGDRKPDPQLALQAAREMAVPIEQCWFVGDSINRDIACARRAGVGAAVLMLSARTDREAPMPDMVPDIVVRTGHELLSVLEKSLRTV